MLARVCRVDRGALTVLLEDGTSSRADPGPLPPDPVEAPTVGDRVEVVDGHVVHRLPRTSLLARRTAGKDSSRQPLAANVDAVLVCAALTGALPVRRLERLLTLAWDSGATPVLVLTKADVCDDLPAAVRQAQRTAPGVHVVAVSAAAGDVAGLAPYDTGGQTLVLLGASGTGKSTLVNALAGEQVMETQTVRRVDGKGRHTTTHRELLPLPSGAVVIDTPGLRAVALQGDEQALARTFADVEDLAVACRFADCAHAGEPGCAVAASVAAGDLDAERVDSWRRLQRELSWQARRTDVRLQQAERQRWRQISKEQRARGGRP